MPLPLTLTSASSSSSVLCCRAIGRPEQLYTHSVQLICKTWMPQLVSKMWRKRTVTAPLPSPASTTLRLPSPSFPAEKVSNSVAGLHEGLLVSANQTSVQQPISLIGIVSSLGYSCFPTACSAALEMSSTWVNDQAVVATLCKGHITSSGFLNPPALQEPAWNGVLRTKQICAHLASEGTNAAPGSCRS